MEREGSSGHLGSSAGSSSGDWRERERVDLCASFLHLQLIEFAINLTEIGES